jgi:hypothetical protein
VSCIQVSPYSGQFYTASLDTTFRTWELSKVLATEKFVEPEIEEKEVEDLMTEEERRELEELMGE